MRAVDPTSAVAALRNPAVGGSVAATALAVSGFGLPALLVDTDPSRQKRPVNFRNTPYAAGLGYDPADNPGGGFYASTADPAEMSRWLGYAAGRGMSLNVGMRVGGPVYGGGTLAVVDMDTAAAVGLWASMWAARGFVPPELTVRSPGKRDDSGNWVHAGGGHVWMMLPAGVAEKVKPTVTIARGGTAADGVDVKVRDSFVMLPPSVRDEGPYSWAGGDMVAAPDWFVSLLLDSGSRPAPGPRRKREESAVLDEWNDNHPWTDILEEAGWTESGAVDSCGCPIFARPDGSSSRSGVAHEPGCNAGTLHLYTTDDRTAIGDYAEAVGKSSLSRIEVSAALEFPGVEPAEAKRMFMERSGLSAALDAERYGRFAFSFAPMGNR